LKSLVKSYANKTFRLLLMLFVIDVDLLI